MRLVIFGLTISSSWGNGHATLWRGLCGALARTGHHVTFFERDVPYYAAHRDLHALAGGEFRLYNAWDDVSGAARDALGRADAGIVTSYCPDALAASALMLDSKAARVFYDLDTPVTLARLDATDGGGGGAGDGAVPHLGPRGLRDFDLVLSFTGGPALDALRGRLGARRVAPLYGSVDPGAHRPVPRRPGARRAALSYLGTYAADRQRALDALFLEVARRRTDRRFLLGGSLYPDDFPWAANVDHVRHVAPHGHAAFYAGAALTLNVTRGPMAAMGYCPSGRLFEAAACGAPILSDRWEGIERFFTPGAEILLAETTEDALGAIGLADRELDEIACAARERALTQHTAARRAAELVALIESAGPGGAPCGA